MGQSNCLAFVLTIARYRRKGDYLLIRKSLYGWFPHFAAVVDCEGGIYKIEFVPVAPYHRWLPALFFKGKIIVTRYIELHKEEYDDQEHFRSSNQDFERRKQAPCNN